jgi:hypothetical protein
MPGTQDSRHMQSEVLKVRFATASRSRGPLEFDHKEWCKMRLPGFTAENSLYTTMGYRTVAAPAPGTKNYQVCAQTICPPWDPLCGSRICAPYCTPCTRGEQACRGSDCQWQKVGCCPTLACCFNVCHGIEPCDCYCQCVNSIGLYAPPNNPCIGGLNDPDCDAKCTCLCYQMPPGCSP